jgi:Rrf2 family transcriptional regulator, cysteine metabolism repressor
MKVSSKAEYACVAMLELALNHVAQNPVRVKSIAAAHGLEKISFLVQSLLALKAAGLVESVRGQAGGYRLARPPSEISVADIVYAIDRPQPRPNRKSGPVTGVFRALRGVWKEAQAEEQRFLEAVSLADLVSRTQENSPLSYQI